MIAFPVKHQTHLESLLQFIDLIALVAAYFVHVSWKFDAATLQGPVVVLWNQRSRSGRRTT
jgi:hypothetical protein